MTVEFFISELRTKFQLKLIIFIFRTKLAQKGYFQSKIDAMTTTIEFCIFRFSLGMKFHFEQTILNFWTRYAQKRYLRSKPKILHIQISLGTKF